MHVTNSPRHPVSDISLQECDDRELLDLFRRGHPDAYATLFARYRYAARRLALHLGQREEADDVVSESFAQVLGLLRRGKGPQSAFRAYLFTTIRHESGRRAKARKRVTPTVDAMIDSAVPFGAGRLDDFETSAIRAAYTSLPDRWRLVLWQVDVEGRKPHELSDAMAMSANGISALAYRARAGLRDAYLQQHVGTSAVVDAVHAEIRMSLAGVVRRTASRRDQEKVHAHLAVCPACMAVIRELEETNRHIGSIALPAAMTASIAAIAGTAVVKTGVTSQWDALAGKLISVSRTRRDAGRTSPVPATAA